MTTDVVEQSPEGTGLVAAFRAAAPLTRDRRFRVTLAVAFVAHALVLLGLVRTMPQQMGDPNSTPDAVAVSFVSEAELRDATTGADGGGAAAAQQPSPAAPAAQPPAPPEPPQQQAAIPAEPAPPPPPVQQKSDAAEKAPASPPEVKDIPKAEKEMAPETPMLQEAVPAEAPPPKEKADETTTKMQEPDTVERQQQDLAKDNPELLALPDPAKAQVKSQKQPAKKPQKQAMRSPDMTLPGQSQTMMTSPDGRAAGIQRPAGITRSGANDDFARGVIRALRQTMPQMNVLGRVTVRILINMNGNIESVEVLSRSDNTDLNRAVVFSTKQASFPFPPNGATLVDRTFTITYIYH